MNRALPILTLAIAAALCAVMPASTDAGVGDPVPMRKAPRCTEAAIETISLPMSVEVDEIRVEVDHRSPARGAVRVEVLAGDYARDLHITGSLSLGLQFSPPLRGSRYAVALTPDFDAPVGACVDKITLYDGGMPVAVVHP